MLVEVGNEWHVSGMAAWKCAEVNDTEILPGTYGEASDGVRLTHYADWIAATTQEWAN